MPDIQIKIKNLPQIRAAFSQAPRLMTRELNVAIRRTAVGIYRKEFSFYHSLGIRIITRGLYSSITRGIYIGNLTAEVGPHARGNTPVDYAGYVHEGTRYMKGRPYLRRAVESEELNTDENFTRAVQKVLNIIGSKT